MMARMLGIFAEEVENISHAQLAHCLAATFDGRVGEFSFLRLELQNSLLDGVGDGQTVNDDILRLVQTMNAVNGLLFDKLVIT